MRKIILDTEATGLDPAQGHRIVEVAAVEIIRGKISSKVYHRYINPEREVDDGAAEVHGLTLDRLQDESKFAEIAPSLVDFIKGAELIIHNAPFDVGFLNSEFERASFPAVEEICKKVTDTLAMAKELNPGKKNNLDALCAKFAIPTSGRASHGALLDVELLAEVYLKLSKMKKSPVLH